MEKGQIPFPTDRALNNAGGSRPVSLQKNHKYIETIIWWHNPPPTHTRAVLSLFTFQIPILGRRLLVCDCFGNCSHPWGRTTSPPQQLLTILLSIMCISVKTVCLMGSRESTHCPKYILIYIYPMSDMFGTNDIHRPFMYVLNTRKGEFQIKSRIKYFLMHANLAMKPPVENGRSA